MSFQKRLALTVLASVLAFYFGYLIAIHPQLPDKVAAHFNAQGAPDNEMSKSRYAWMMVLVQVGMSSFLVLIAGLMSKLPDSLINLPRKKYWLAPERRGSTLDSLAVYTIWVAVITAALFFTLTYFIDRFNLTKARNLDSAFYFALAGYMVLLLLLTARLVLKFSSIDKTE